MKKLIIMGVITVAGLAASVYFAVTETKQNEANNQNDSNDDTASNNEDKSVIDAVVKTVKTYPKTSAAVGITVASTAIVVGTSANLLIASGGIIGVATTLPYTIRSNINEAENMLVKFIGRDQYDKLSKSARKNLDKARKNLTKQATKQHVDVPPIAEAANKSTAYSVRLPMIKEPQNVSIDVLEKSLTSINALVTEGYSAPYSMLVNSIIDHNKVPELWGNADHSISDYCWEPGSKVELRLAIGSSATEITFNRDPKLKGER